MSRYIDADFVANGLREVLHKPISEFPDEFEQAINCLVYAISILQFAPAADVAPVVHAYNKSKDGFLCSACTFGDFGLFNHGGKYTPKYCPNCGARMDGEKE